MTLWRYFCKSLFVDSGLEARALGFGGEVLSTRLGGIWFRSLGAHAMSIVCHGIIYVHITLSDNSLLFALHRWLGHIYHAEWIRLLALISCRWSLVPLRHRGPQTSSPGNLASVQHLSRAWAWYPGVDVTCPALGILLLLLAQDPLRHIRVQLPRVLVLLSQFILTLQGGDIALAQSSD